jgi:pilus assembly protein CpaD
LNDGRREEMTMIPTTPAGNWRGRWPVAIKAGLVVLAGGWLAGCKTTETADTVPYAYDYRERHPITLHEGTHTAELFLGRRRAGLTPVQREDVDAFAQSWHRDSAGGIEIHIPAGTGNARAARETVPEIEAVLVAAGVPRNGIAVQPYPGDPSQLVPIVLAYPRIKAVAGPCGRWPNDLGPGAGVEYDTNIPYWNLGCATQRNLASMVDNQADLVGPRGEAPAYTARRSVVLDKYRKGEPTEALNPNADKGKISEVGK